VVLSDRWALVVLIDVALRIVEMESLCWTLYVTWSLRRHLVRHLENLRPPSPEVAPAGGDSRRASAGPSACDSRTSSGSDCVVARDRDSEQPEGPTDP
jgi:hypothetical protein